MKTIKISLLGCIFLLSSCSTVQFYSDSNLSKKTGLKVYSAKPYLLVEYAKKDAAKDNKKGKTPNEDTPGNMTSIIYLPDIGKPQYIKLKAGLGSSDLQVALTDGMVTSYGLKSDSKIPETITSIGGILTGLKALIAKSDSLAAEKSNLKEVEKPIFDLYEILMDDNGTSLKKVVLVK
jgi:hypothetical protein